ncbi:MAG: periplasmic heavy metal sensor [Thalassobaculaceae bacterium]
MSEIKPRRRRWLLGGLVASLAVNMFLIGWMVGAAPRGGPFGIWSSGAGPTAATPRWLRDGLGSEGMDRFAVNWRRHRAEMKPLVAEIKPLQGELRAALGAEPFDRARYTAALAALRAHHGALQAQVHAVMADTVADLSPDQRRQLMNAVGGRRGAASYHRHWWRRFDNADSDD